MTLLLLRVWVWRGRRLEQDNNILFALKQETAIRYFTHNFLCQSVWKTYWIFWEADLALTTSRHWTKAITRFFCVFFVFSWVKMRLDFAFRQRFYLFDTSWIFWCVVKKVLYRRASYSQVFAPQGKHLRDRLRLTFPLHDRVFFTAWK